MENKFCKNFREDLEKAKKSLGELNDELEKPQGEYDRERIKQIKNELELVYLKSLSEQTLPYYQEKALHATPQEIRESTDEILKDLGYSLKYSIDDDGWLSVENLSEFTGKFYQFCTVLKIKRGLITKVRIREIALGDFQVMSLLEILEHENNKIRELDLEENDLGDSLADMILDSTTYRNNKLEAINLTANRLTKYIIGNLIDKYDSPNFKLKSIDLNSNHIDGEFFNVLDIILKGKIDELRAQDPNWKREKLIINLKNNWIDVPNSGTQLKLDHINEKYKNEIEVVL